MKTEFPSLVRTFVLGITFAAAAFSQGTLADYERGEGLHAKARDLVLNAPGPSNWIGETEHFWYYRSVKGGTEFIWVDAATATKKVAFDHDKLAEGINAVTGGHYTGLQLPFAPTPPLRAGARPVLPPSSPLTFVDNERAIEFGVLGSLWKCTLSDYVCVKSGAIIPLTAGGRGPQAVPESDDLLAAPLLEGCDPVDGLEYTAAFPHADGGRPAGAARAATPCAVRNDPSSAGRNARGGRGAGASQLGSQPGEISVCA